MKHNILGAACASLLIALSGAANAASISGQGTWESTLQGRDLDGDLSTFEAYYDTVLDITWLAKANYSGAQMTWSAANAWAAGLTLGGYTDWRLPNTGPVNGASYDNAFTYDGSTDKGYNISAPGTAHAGSTGSEMAHLYYNTLGNLAYSDTSGVSPQPGGGLTNTGPFSNVVSYYYWSATEYAPNTSGAWLFGFNKGDQSSLSKTGNNLLAWAVHAGDVGVSEVPVPAAAWLFASGMLGLMGVSRKRRRC